MKTNTATSLAIKGLSGAVTLAGATQAYGAVVAANPPDATTITGTSTSTTFSPGETTWDVDGDGTADFYLGAKFFNKTYFGLSKNASFTGIAGYYGTSNQVVGYTGTVPLFGSTVLVTDLSNGATVGPTSAFAIKPGYYSLLGTRYGTTASGQFAATTGTTGFVGFEFTEADGTLHYGYGEFTSILNGKTATLTYDGGYYETTPNTPIAIGTAVPEPGSLAALAFGLAGAAGAAAYRRQQAA